MTIYDEEENDTCGNKNLYAHTSEGACDTCEWSTNGEGDMLLLFTAAWLSLNVVIVLLPKCPQSIHLQTSNRTEKKEKR